MPLSEHEQRLLEQMERALHAEDPKFASTMRGADLRVRYRRRALLAAAAFILGIVALMAGAITEMIAVGVAGFVVMLVSAWYAVTSWRRTPAPGDLGTFAQTPAKRRSGRRAGLMERVEERWRRRRDEMGR